MSQPVPSRLSTEVSRAAHSAELVGVCARQQDGCCPAVAVIRGSADDYRSLSFVGVIPPNCGVCSATPGGSSGGASASVAAGITTLAIGTDMGGSPRLPASYTGLVGMRPSTGRIPRRFGFLATAIDFQVIGPFTRTMRDMRLLYGALAGPDPRDPYSLRFPTAPDVTPDRRFRIGWFTAIGDEGATLEVAASVAGAVGSLAGANCEVARYPPPSTSALYALFMPC
jgi:Asp-tRNA(Asn)/Glu-tRNA(Gln) amidotransferase A subunit family amidase